MTNGADVDLTAIFDAMPTPYLVLDPELRIVALNAARERVTGMSRAEVLGRSLFEVFPDNPDDPSAAGVGNLGASLARVLATGESDTMPLQRYDVRDGDGTFVPRWWSPVNTPVLDAQGRVSLLLHRVEDVTDYVADRELRGGPDGAEDPDNALYEALEGRRRAESDLYARGQELRTALTDQTAISHRLAGMVQVALRLTAAETLADLTEAVVDSGMSVLGASGGAMAVRTDVTGGDGQSLDLTFTDSLGGHAQRRYARLPLLSPLPVAVAARTGRTVVLRDRHESVAFCPEMAQAVEDTGLGTWVALPLQTAGRPIGSLTIGWADPREFSDGDVELMTALAAQCAQSLAVVQAREQERRAAGEQRRLSETLQRSLLTKPFEPDHLQIAVRYLPAAAEAQIGGDWYDCFVGPNGSTTLVVGDVAGHDRDAAAAMGQVRNLLRGVSTSLAWAPAAVLTGLDRSMLQLGVGVIATAVLAQVEQSDAEQARGLRTMRWSNAGHPPPILMRPDGSAALLQSTPDLLLGLLPDAERSDHTVTLEPGSTIVFYTDGLVERRDAALQEGLDWLRGLLEELHELPIEEMCDEVLTRVSDLREDDIALLVLRAHPEDAPRPTEAGPQVLPPNPPERVEEQASDLTEPGS